MDDGVNNKKCINAVSTTTKFPDNQINDYLNGDLNNIFYAVHIPSDSQTQDGGELPQVIFEDKNDALNVAKMYKKARFKAFQLYQEAIEFVLHGAEYPNNNSRNVDSLHKASNGDVPVQSNVGEKPSQFRGPSSQNLVKLRKDIENGDIDNVRKTVWDNPRYLIGAGDTPSILQEGFRYNSLHVAVKSKNPAMCELILNTISDITFIRKLYADDKNPEDRAKILLDLYLNTPDKGMHETPLHFAVKFGALKCVEVLVSFPQCDRNLRNKHGNLPNEIICSRYDEADKDAVFDGISNLLQDSYYVPVLRSEDNCSPAIIGEPFSPTSPPNFNKDPLSPRMEIHAYAGPMNKEGASKFRKLWKTPPRTPNLNSPQRIVRSDNNDCLATLKLKDPKKGLERLGSTLAKQLDVGWKEYWPFLDSFVDISSEEGLRLFENYLAQRANKTLILNTNDNLNPTDITMLENMSLAKSVTEESPISELCKILQACTLKDTKRSVNFDEPPIDSPFSYVDKSLQVFAKRISNDINHLLNLQYDTCSVLETQIKQLQLLMSSYIDDIRFAAVDFHLVHGRLAHLIHQLLVDVKDLELLDKMLDLWLEFFDKNYDCFSSDDEGVQNTVIHSKNQHTICILKKLQESLMGGVMVCEEVRGESECVQLWKRFKPCACIWKHKTKRLYSNKRSNSFKVPSTKKPLTSRKLSFDELDNDTSGSVIWDFSSNNSECNYGLISDDEFYTPPMSPHLLDDEGEDNLSDNDTFEDAELPLREVYIEGDAPTKVDNDVFNALQYTECDFEPCDYPNIYRWRHAISLYNENERKGWTNKNNKTTSTPLQQKITQVKNVDNSMVSSESLTPPSWLRVTGANSPRASLKSQRGNVSFTY